MIAFIRAYVVTMRPYLLFVSGIVGIAGLALAPALPAGKTILLAAAFCTTYGFGQALTDVFQIDTDALSSPYRPLVRGAIRRRSVLAVSFAGLLGSGVLFAVCNRLNIVLGMAAVLGLVTYTPFKRRWWSGPFYNAWIVALLFAIAFLCGGGSLRAGARPTEPFVLALVAVFVGYACFVLVGYCKDVSADRATGYRTIPVVFGLGATAWIADSLAILAIALCAAILTRLPVAAALPFAVAGAALTILGEARLHRLSTENGAHRAIVPNLHGYVLLLTGVAVAARPAWAVLLVLYYGAFVFVMRRRPMRGQI
jgi:4-hydroxybenzoate polyprenyltransferase